MNGANKLIGTGRMIGDYNPNKDFNLWTTDNYVKGVFELEWIFIKDIENKYLKDLDLR